MKRIAITLLVLLILVGICINGNVVNVRNQRWSSEIDQCDNLDRLYEIKDSMDYFREQIEDDLYKKCQDKVSKYELLNYE